MSLSTADRNVGRFAAAFGAIDYDSPDYEPSPIRWFRSALISVRPSPK